VKELAAQLRSLQLLKEKGAALKASRAPERARPAAKLL